MSEVVLSRDQTEGKTEAETNERVELAIKADNGDKDALEKLKAKKHSLPKAQSGILKNHQRQMVVALVTRCDQHFTKWTVGRDIEFLEKQLAGPNPTPLESMLAETAATCFMQWQVSSSGCWGEYISESVWKRTERCHKMLMQSLKTLAYVRKVPVGTLMVNMAEMQQVNVGKRNTD